MDDKREEKRVGVLGATSLVGVCLLPLLTKAGWQVTAFSRKQAASAEGNPEWRRLPVAGFSAGVIPEFDAALSLPFWICLTPIWVLPDYFAWFDTQDIRRLVVLSSTSCFTKGESTDREEQALARRFADAEAQVRAWANHAGVEFVILRPTLIYRLGLDKNITVIARFISRFGFFPIFGQANGLRQPIHAEDVAGACIAALQSAGAANRDYNISGGETLTYRTMVTRIFLAFGRQVRFFPVPLSVFRLSIALLRFFPHYKNWSAAMAERMNSDMIFEHSDAERDLGFKPRKFELDADYLGL
jgi:nucleoside-diphosphate-sugar epimerase